MKLCPHCGKSIEPVKRAKPPADVGSVDTSKMTNAELFAYYKKTGPLEDVRFFIRTGILSPAVRAGAEALEAAILELKPARAEIFRQLGNLQDRWRRERYFETVIAPAARLERRRLKARARMARQAVSIAA